MTSSYFQKGISMSIKQKYLKDENGEVFSPIVSADSIYDSDGNPAPQIVAWCYATINNEVATIHAGKNIASLTLGTSVDKPVTVNFRKALKDVYYAAIVSAEYEATGTEIIGVYNHKTTSFTLDMSTYTGAHVRPQQLNIVVIR